MKLSAIRQLPSMQQCWVGNPNAQCTQLQVDARQVVAGNGFYALQGERLDGHAFARDAWKQGASALFVNHARCFEHLCHQAQQQTNQVGAALKHLPGGPPGIFLTPTSRQALGQLASWLHGQPSQHINVLAVTGTNGKTSCVHLVSQLLKARQLACASLGTLGLVGGNLKQNSILTTPEPCQTQAFLAAMHQQRIGWAALEASSIGLLQGRLSGVALHAAAFTNLSVEHLDLHHTMDAYFAHKLLLFTQHKPKAWVINADSPYAKRIWQAWRDCNQPAPLLAFALQPASLQAPWLLDASQVLSTTNLTPTQTGSGWRGDLHLAQGDKKTLHPQQTQPFQLALAGEHNVSNLLCAFGLLLVSGLTLAQLAPLAQHCTSPPGRLECLPSQAPFRVMIDYAHTPHALQCALLAARHLLRVSVSTTTKHPTPRAKLWVVFGCGGGRDTQKRPQMGAIAEQLADQVVLTSDNPRNEDPLTILKDIRGGMRQPNTATQQPNREEAIAWTLDQAQAGDVVLIAGKGHENYQEIAGKRRPFDDKNQVNAWLKQQQLAV